MLRSNLKLTQHVALLSVAWLCGLSIFARSRLEGVVIRVLKRFLAVYDNVHHDVLRMELGCRSMRSWMTQRVLEYGFRLRRMTADRLPAAVHAAVWKRAPARC